MTRREGGESTSKWRSTIWLSGVKFPFIVLTVAIAVDLGLIATHVAVSAFAEAGRENWLFTNPWWLLTTERGFPELVQYHKSATIAELLLLAAFLARWSSGFAWAAVFGFVWADDLLMVHERGGDLVASFLPASVAGLRADHAGEVVVWLLAGAILLPLVALAFRADDRTGKAFSVRLAVVFVALAGVGAGLDVAHSLAPGDSLSGELLSVLEDGGEMLFVSVALAVAVDAAGLAVRQHLSNTEAV